MKSETKLAAKVFEEEPKRSKKLPELKNMMDTFHKRTRIQETQKKESIQIVKKVIEALEKRAS